MRAFGLAILGAVLLAATAAQAGECPGNPNALGTSRTIVVDPTEHPRLGGMQYRESLPLRDHEVVFTFDDGPLPPRSTKVLDILASECIKATYFLVGKMARSYPEVVRRIRAEGHTLGNHSYSHPLTFQKMPLDKAQTEINDGFASIAWALGDGIQPAPFFRIPGLLRADGVERYLASREVQVWSADFPADDWFRKLGAQQVYQRAIQRIEAHHKGILLLHDIHQRTVDALPMIIRDLKAKGYHIVHVVPASPTMPKTVTAANEWTVRGRSLWQQTPVFADIDPELPAPAPESFGYVSPFDINSVVHGPIRRRHKVAAAGAVPPLPTVSIWRRIDEAPPALPAVMRTPLPAPSPDSFGYPSPEGGAGASAAKPAMKRGASFNLVPETNGADFDFRRSFPDTIGLDDGPTGSVRPSLRGPVPGPLHRGAFP